MTRAIREGGATGTRLTLTLLHELRRRGVTAGDRYVADMHEVFRRMVFNILIDNTDDHEKNHAILVTDAQQYALAPAYDVLPSGQGLGFQQMRVGELEADSTLANALSMAQLFELSKSQAVAQVRRVARVVAGWRKHFTSCGVTRRDVELLVPERARAVHVAHRNEYIAHARTRPMGAGFDLSGRRRDGSEFPVEISLSPVQTEEGAFTISAIRDVTDRRRTDERFRALLESAR